MKCSRKPSLAILGLVAVVAAPTFGQEAPKKGDESHAVIARALESVSDDVREFNDHVVTLSSPFMEGRVPGSNGMEVAKQYMEYWFKQVGLQPGFKPEGDGEGVRVGSTFRQPFALGKRTKITERRFSVANSDESFESRSEFKVLTAGTSGTATGPITFAGYGIDEGPNGFVGFAEDDDLTGKIAMIFRFEPMDEDGRSRWSPRGRAWSDKAGYDYKFRSITALNPAAIILVNPPGCADRRARNLRSMSAGASGIAKCPVIGMSTRTAMRLVEALGAKHTLLEMREKADAGRAMIDLGGEATVTVKYDDNSLIAENVGGLLVGRGKLKNEVIVVGGHLDHLGMGEFGSRRGRGELHPGADDNASGSAALIMLGRKLKKFYDDQPADVDLRSVLFCAFSAEESGLNGSGHYVNNPIVSIEDHAFMINFDMIGRITNKRLLVDGASSAEGLGEWLKPHVEKTSLEIVQRALRGGGSDHLVFMQKKVPYLFSIIADFHNDYHTPDDTADKINRVDAVATIDFYEGVLQGLSTRPERFEFKSRGRRRRQP